MSNKEIIKGVFRVILGIYWIWGLPITVAFLCSSKEDGIMWGAITFVITMISGYIFIQKYYANSNEPFTFDL